MYVYLDESGDLGFGQRSTKYFTIAFVVMKNPVRLKRCVRKVKEKYSIPSDAELKGSVTSKNIKQDLLRRLAALDIEVHAITVEKKNVETKLQKNTNILYNYMVGLSLVERILEEPKGATVIINVDRRITSVTSGFNLDQYLMYKIWYEKERRDINLAIHQLDSHHALSIQGIDVVCNSIFRKYSSKNYELFNIIQDKIRSDRHLFFSK